MAGHIERKEIIYMLIVISFVLGIFYFYKGQHLLNDMPGGTHKKPIISSKSVAKRAFQKNIEASLNQMLSDVYGEMKAYRERRKILDDIIRPQNLQNAKYINESYQLAGQTISDLKQRSNRIIKIFDTKDAEIKTLIKGRPQSAQANILAAWKKMKSQQVNLYVQYFTIEQEILQTYQSLVTLYYRHQNEVVYYQETNQTAFQSSNLNAQATQLSQKIKTLKNKQASLSK